MNSKSELERLRRENKALNEQVKRLVRTERRLSLSQQELDRQFHRVNALNAFSLSARRTDDPAEILTLAIDALFAVLPYEQAVGFMRNNGVFRPVATKAAQGLECKLGPFATVPASSFSLEQFPSGPVAGTTLQIRRDYPGTIPFLNMFQTCPGCEAALPEEDPALMACPIFIEGRTKLTGILLLRRLSLKTSYLEQLPDEEDLPFLDLMSTHLSQAVENVLLYHETKRSVKVRDEFLSIASHELRTPLTPLKNELQLIHFLATKDLLAVFPKPRLLKLIHIADRELIRLTRLIDGMLEVTRMTAGRFTLNREEILLSSLIQEMVARFQRVISESGSQIILDLHDREPGFWDRLRIEQVITNLLTNAIRYGSGKPITIRTWMNNGNTVISVEDQGIGISPEAQARLFRKFETVVSSHHFGGLGLGLYISRQIVEAHGGTIHVTSSPGRGTTFVITLPLVPADTAQEQEAA